MTIQKLTRKDIITQHFQGIEDPDTHLTAVLEALELKGNAKSFGPKSVHSIAVSREWINSGEAKDYEQLALLWAERKAEVESAFNANGNLVDPLADNLETSSNESALTTSAENEFQANDNVNGNASSPAHILAKPARENFEAGKQLIESSADRILHNQQLTAQVLDAAFFEGVKEGMGKVGETKKFQPPALLTQEQAADIVQKIVKDSRQSNNSKSE